MTEDQKFELLKKINSKMGWAVFFLVCITLNTCSLSDDLSDAARDMRRTQTEAAAQSSQTSAPAIDTQDR